MNITNTSLPLVLPVVKKTGKIILDMGLLISKIPLKFVFIATVVVNVVSCFLEFL